MGGLFSVADLVQVLGAFAVLIGFLLAQLDRIEPASYRYLLPNLLGSAALTATAAVAQEWGFVFLEASWALVSVWGLTQRRRGATPRAGH